MSVLPILKWPDPRLSQSCAPVDEPGALRGLVDDMFETMYAAPGRGLAAPQVGVMKRLFVMDAGWKEGERTPLACIDPHVISKTGTVVPGEEGCLSVPGVTAQVERAGEVLLGYRDLDGAAQQAQLSGAAARIAQHELDHLDGIMHFDRLDANARDALLADYESVS